MEKILKLIPNKIEDNQDIEKMIQYLNKSIEELDVVIFERQKEKNAYFVVPRKIYDENLVREKNGEKIIGNRNVLTCWQFKTKIMLSIRPMFNPSKSNDKCTFLNIQDLEKENIDFVIKNKYKELINNN
ncbi:hypothetical protein [Clostridium beijerinckii]|nr:hypothetical protein [Clostridium beijerinckii]